MLSTQHFDSPRHVAWCLLRQRTASKGASKHYWLRHAANQEVQSVNVITGEEVSNTDPQLTVLHLNPINKRFCRRQIDPLHIYSIYEKKTDVFSTRRSERSEGQIPKSRGGCATKMLHTEIIKLLNASNQSTHALCIDRKLRSFWVECHSYRTCQCSRTYILNNLIHQLHNVFLLRLTSECTDGTAQIHDPITDREFRSHVRLQRGCL